MEMNDRPAAPVVRQGSDTTFLWESLDDENVVDTPKRFCTRTSSTFGLLHGKSTIQGTYLKSLTGPRARSNASRSIGRGFATLRFRATVKLVWHSMISEHDVEVMHR